MTTKTRRRAVLWDLDGTIADTSELHFHAWRNTLAVEGVAYSRFDFEQDFGRSNPEILAERFPHMLREEHQRIADNKESAYRTDIPGRIQMLPGVQTWLMAFRTTGVPQIVCSSGPMANIAASVVELGIADHFLALISGVHVPRGKPDPDLFLRGAAVAAVAADHCLVVEDSRHGVEAALQAGMNCVVVGMLAQQIESLYRQANAPEQLWAAHSLNYDSWSAAIEWWNRKTG